MKHYLLFAGLNYYPAGGWDDFVASYDTIAGAIVGVLRDAKNGHDWYQIVDIATGEIVASG